MPAPAVTFDGTNVTNAEAADDANWDDASGGPGSANESDFPIQGSEYRARRADNVTNSGFTFDNTSGIDLSAYRTHVGLWMLCLQPSLTTKAQVYLGGGSAFETSPWSSWSRFGTGSEPTTYPARGGWQRVWLDPTRARDEGAGTLALNSVRQFGVRYTIGNVGGTTKNFAQDRTDYISGGGGLTLTDGTGGDPGKIQNFVTFDPDTNVMGVVIRENGVTFVTGRLTIGSGTLTVFNDSAFKLVFARQPLASKDFMGITVDLSNASTDVDFKNALVASGGTNKGDLVVSGTSGAFNDSGTTYESLRRIKLSNKCVMPVTFAASGQIDPTNADYDGFVDLPGTDEYVDTQQTLDLSSVSNDFEIIMCIEPDDWTPAAIDALMSHYGGTIATESFRFRLNTAGTLALIVSDGSAETTFTSNTLTLVTDGNPAWVRVKYDHSLGRADFFSSLDPLDTPVGDIVWTARGTPTGTARAIPSLTRIMQIGAENDGTPAQFFNGAVRYAELWTDGFRATGADHGDLRFRADWRNGPSFSGTPSVRNDDFLGASLVWELQGTAPTYTAGDNNTGAADIKDSVVRNSTSVAAIKWDVNADPTGELDNVAFTSAGTGHAMEFGPNTPATIALNGHSYTGYAASDGSTGNEVIYNNTGGSLTINVTDGDTPTIRNGTSASTTVNNNVSVTLTGLKDNTEVRVFEAGTLTVVDGTEAATDGSPGNRSFTFTDAVSDSVDIRIFAIGFLPADIFAFTIPSSAASIPITQVVDRSFENP